MLLNRVSVRFLCLLLLLFSYSIAFAQTGTDSLLTEWRKIKTGKSYTSDSASVKLLNLLSGKFRYIHTDSSLYFAKEALRIAQTQKYVLGEATAQNNICKTCYVMGDYIQSSAAAEKLMSISNKINYQAGIASSYQITGLIYQVQNKHWEAINSITRALQIYTSIKDKPGTTRAYFNIGLCYDEMGQPEKAFDYLKKSTEIARQAGDTVMLLMSINRTGEAYFHLKDYKTALKYYQQVIDSKFASDWELDFSYSGVAQSYYGLGDYNKAILNAKKSLDLSREVNSSSDAVRALQILSDSYAAINDYKQAYDNQVLLKKTNDGLFNSVKDKEVNYLHLKQQQANNIRLENEIRAKEEAIAFSKRLLFIRNLVAVFTIILLLIIIKSNRQKTAMNKVLQKQNEDIAAQKEEIITQKEALDQLNNTKDQLFSVISHDLRSPFAAIMQSIDAIRSGTVSAQEQAQILDGFYQQVSLVNLMVNNLLVWAASQQSGIKTDAESIDITGTVNEVISVCNYLAKDKKISLRHTYDAAKMVSADLNHVKIIIQNLIGNAIKFTPNDGTIEVYYTEDETYQAIHVKDSGVGISTEKMDKLFKITGKEISGYGTNNEAGAGIGLALIKEFIDANDGELEVKSSPATGSEFIVYLRKASV